VGVAAVGTILLVAIVIVAAIVYDRSRRNQ
jgi:Na+/serine symporter